MKIISGGQTGVDRAALMAAQDLGIPTGGWCPPGRLAEDGIIPDRFPLKETPDDRSKDAPHIPRSQRTEWNVRDSDATLLIIPRNIPDSDKGTALTLKYALEYNKPYFICNPDKDNDSGVILSWIEDASIDILNISGPSELSVKGITRKAYELIHDVLSIYQNKSLNL